MRRGEIWTAAAGSQPQGVVRPGEHRSAAEQHSPSEAAGSGYVGKPRPVVIVQADHFDGTASVTVVAFTTDPTTAPLLRLVVVPDGDNGLREPCSLMVDKITTVSRSKLGQQLGRLADDDMVRLARSVVVFLGLAG